MNQFDASQIVFFHGDVNPHLAHIYVRLPSEPEQGVQMRGQVCGPRSRLTRTLPTSVPLVDLGAGPSMLARALVPDPCCWGPGQPYVYDVEVEVCRGSERLLWVSQSLGLRSFGLCGNRLLLQRQPWTVAGCYDASVMAAPWDAWRDSQLARVIASPLEHTCAEASDEGVLLIADLTGTPHSRLGHELQRLGKWAAVAMIFMDPNAALGSLRQAWAPNVVLVELVVESDARILSEGFDLAVRDWSHSTPVSPLAAAGAPWIARRRLGSAMSLEEAVEQCQLLQRETRTAGLCVGCLV